MSDELRMTIDEFSILADFKHYKNEITPKSLIFQISDFIEA